MLTTLCSESTAYERHINSYLSFMADQKWTHGLKPSEPTSEPVLFSCAISMSASRSTMLQDSSTHNRLHVLKYNLHLRIRLFTWTLNKDLQQDYSSLFYVLHTQQEISQHLHLHSEYTMWQLTSAQATFLVAPFFLNWHRQKIKIWNLRYIRPLWSSSLHKTFTTVITLFTNLK